MTEGGGGRGLLHIKLWQTIGWRRRRRRSGLTSFHPLSSSSLPLFPSGIPSLQSHFAPFYNLCHHPRRTDRHEGGKGVLLPNHNPPAQLQITPSNGCSPFFSPPSQNVRTLLGERSGSSPGGKRCKSHRAAPVVFHNLGFKERARRT